MAPGNFDDIPLDSLLGLLEDKLAGVNGRYPEFPAAELGKYVERAKQILTRLVGLSNSILPINRLPPELLLKIFRTFRDDTSRRFLFPPTTRKHHEPLAYEWMNITRVCSHWRSLAIQSPGLWRYIPIECKVHDDFRSCIMQRSAPQKIHLLHYHDLSLCQNSYLDNLQTFIHHQGDRLESLHLALKGRNASRHAARLLNHSFPSLLELSLHFIPTNFIPDSLNVPQIFHGNPSTVKRLAMNKLWCWPQNNAVFPDLTHLVLSEIPSMSVPRLLPILAQWPYLEVLHITGDISCLETQASGPSQPLPVPHLKVLRWECRPSGEGYSEWLQYLILPPTTTILISSDDDLPNDSILKHILNSSPISVTCLHIHSHAAETDHLLIHKNQIFIHYFFMFPYIGGISSRITEIQFTDIPGRLKVFSVNVFSIKWEGNTLVHWLQEFTSLSTIRCNTPTNYLVLLDAIAMLPPVTVPISKVYVKRMGIYPDKTSGYDPERIMAYERAGTTVIKCATWGGRYQLVVEPYDPEDPYVPFNVDSLVESLY